MIRIKYPVHAAVLLGGNVYASTLAVSGLPFSKIDQIEIKCNKLKIHITEKSLLPFKVEDIASGSPLYRTPFSFYHYDTDTVHVLTRHPHNTHFPGYFGPLTATSWMAFSALLILMITTLFLIELSFTGAYANILYFCSLFHFEVLKTTLTSFRGGLTIQLNIFIANISTGFSQNSYIASGVTKFLFH